MKMKPLGRTGVSVSELCFGTMSFGGDADEEASGAMYAACRDAGINFFDCANIYSNGLAEQILGRLIAHERDSLVITSKCAFPTGDGANERGASRRHIVQAVEASLKRLATERLDILFMHTWDPVTPLEETLRALEDLVRAGKVLYLGASNYAAWQIAVALGMSAKHGWTRFDVIQPMYNLVKRQAEVEILPLARAQGLGVISYGPVGGGLLSGKYASGQKPNLGRLVSHEGYAARYSEEWVYQVAGAFTEYAQNMGVHPVTLAVAWVAANDAVTSPIIGARNVGQLQPSLQSVSLKLDAQARAEISSLSRAPAPATDRLEETL